MDVFTNTRKFVVENVLPSYGEYLEHRVSNTWGESQLVRKAINAAIALYHLREHLPKNMQPKRGQLEGICPDYGLLGDITNAAKHYEINRNNPRISSAEQIYEVLTSTRFSDDMGEYWVPQLEVFVKLNDGTELRMVEILYNVMKMWRDTLDQLSIVNLKEPEPLNLDQLISREEAEKRQSDLHITSGEGYTWNIKLMKYNYNIGRYEPFDLTDHSISFKVYEPPTHIPVHMTLSKNEKIIEFDFDISISVEQGREYMRLNTDQEREAFTQIILESSREIQEQLRKSVEKAFQEAKDP
jgi:hypothetical protein